MPPRIEDLRHAGFPFAAAGEVGGDGIEGLWCAVEQGGDSVEGLRLAYYCLLFMGRFIPGRYFPLALPQ